MRGETPHDSAWSPGTPSHQQPLLGLADRPPAPRGSGPDEQGWMGVKELPLPPPHQPPPFGGGGKGLVWLAVPPRPNLHALGSRWGTTCACSGAPCTSGTPRCGGGWPLWKRGRKSSHLLTVRPRASRPNTSCTKGVSGNGTGQKPSNHPPPLRELSLNARRLRLF